MKRQRAEAQSLLTYFSTAPKSQRTHVEAPSAQSDSGEKPTDGYNSSDDDLTILNSNEGSQSKLPSACDSVCCQDLSAPSQPTDKAIIESTRQSVGKKSETRVVNTKWYKQFPWIHLCVSRQKVFCYQCLKCCKRGLFSKNYESAFISEGFCNWKKALERFARHEKSECHSEALLKLSCMQAPSVSAQLSNRTRHIQAERREMLLKQLVTLKYLLRQGLAIRGHVESEGNLIKLLEMQAKDCPQLGKWLSDSHYLSHGIVNEMITLMGNVLLKNLLTRIRAARWYALMADETRDISNHEQLTVVIRWVDEDFVIHEDFIGMIHVPDTTSSTLTKTLKDVLIRCILPLDSCRGQAYDGASNMMGHLTGVAKQIQDEQPLAIKVHCLAHSLNLCLQDVSKKCKPIRDALDTVMELSKLIRYSPKRTLVFQQCREHMSIEGTGLRPLCPTRWTVRTGAINAVLKNYPALLEALRTISDTCYDDYGRRAGGLHSQLEKFSTYFGLKLSYLIFSGTEQTSTNLQGINTSIQEAVKCAEVALSYLTRLRKDEMFQRFYSGVVKEAEEYTEEPVLPRYKRPPKRLDEGAPPHQFSSVADYYRAFYFEAIDIVSEQISSRFNQKSMSVPQDFERLLLTAANQDASDLDIPQDLLTLYSKDINFVKAKQQLLMLPDLVKAYRRSEGLRLCEVTNIRTISRVMNGTALAKDMFSEINTLLHLYFTIPVTTSTAERSFSSLRRMKTYLRSTMTQERLNNVLLLHVHKEDTDKLDIRSIAEKFVSVNERRQSFFGNF